MRNLVTLISTASLMIHVIFGCCTHHVHGSEQPRLVALLTESHECHSHHHHGSEVPDSSTPADSPCSESQCGVLDCVFTCSAKSNQQQNTQWEILDLATFISPGELIEGPSQTLRIRVDGPIQPPVRLHLFNQILLI